MSIKYIYLFNFIQIVFIFCLFLNTQQYENSTINSVNETDSFWNNTCYRDIDCSIPRSICQNNECVCPEEYPIYSNGKCNLGWGYFESCDTFGGECERKVVNGKCINNICRCPDPQDDYVFDNGKCIIVHPQHCQRQYECENKECVDNHCQCSKGFLNIGKECIKAAPLLSKCFSTLECRLHDDDSICESGTCYCKNGTTYSKNSCISKEAVPIEGRCEINDECLLFTDHSECFNGKCRCIRDKAFFYDNKCLTAVPIDGKCKNNAQCLFFTDHSECFNGKCRCLTDNVFFYNNKCLAVSYFGQKCNSSMQCIQDVYQSRCIDGWCQCPTYLSHFDRLNKQCTSHNLEISTADYCLFGCNPPFKCVSGKCVCGKEKPLNYNGNCYAIAFLGASCFVDLQCSTYDENSVCKNYYCECKEDYRERHGTCFKSAYIGETCLHSGECALGDIHSECVVGRCRCENGYQFDKKCIQSNNNVSPSISWQCSMPKQFIDGQCKCVHPTPIEISNICYESVSFGENCLTSSQCVYEDINSECYLKRCRCKSGYNFDQKCIQSNNNGLYYGKCNFEFDCSLQFSACDNGICVCKYGYIYQEKRCLAKNIKNDPYNGLDNLQTALWILVALFSVLMAVCFIAKCRKSINRTSYIRRTNSLTNQLLESIPSSSHLVNIPSYEELYPNYCNAPSPENVIPHAASHNVSPVPLRTNQEEQNFAVSGQPSDIPILTENSHINIFHSIIPEDDKSDDVPLEHVIDHRY